MVDREERKIQAKKHSALMKGAFASEIESSVAGVVIYEEGQGRELDLPEAAFSQTQTVVTASFAPEAFYREGKGKVALVDPASFTRPGGAYEDGAFGPEQILCADSCLYEVLCSIKKDYHQANRDYRRGGLFSDRAAYLPDVVFSRDGAIRKANIIVAAEPLRVRALENHRSERECDNALAQRIETILRIACINECETVVMGAFGCGREGYEPKQVVELISAWIDAHPGSLGKLVFAVPRAYFDTFNDAFGAQTVEPVEASKPEKAEDADENPRGEDDFDWRNVELPEGVTLR